jgi:transposase InsO family protein
MRFGYLLGLPIAELFAAINVQTEILQRQIGKRRLSYTISERLRLLELQKKLGTCMRGCIDWIASPQALAKAIKRYQERMAQQKKVPDHDGPGRPWLAQTRVDAIVKIYHGGCRGLSRIVGEMKKCGLPVAESTVRNVLNQQGLPPSAGRGRHGATWMQFWRQHAPHTVGIDFLQIPVGIIGKIAYRFVFFAIEHDTRRVHVLGITEHPTGLWILNALRSATMDGMPLAKRTYWVHDNDGKYPKKRMRQLLLDRGLQSVPICPYTPDMNAYAERFVCSIREECFDHIIFINDAMLSEATTTYFQHYNTVRPHQGIGNVTIGPWETKTEGEIVCDTQLYGLLKSFRRAG